MNYQITELQHALAARFVIGSMRGSARQRFIRLQMQFPRLRDEVIFWEQHLNELTQQIPTQPAPQSAWASIQQRLGWDAAPTTSSGKTSWWAWLSSIAAAVLLVVLVQQTLLTEPTPSTDRIAVIQNESARTLWLIEQRDQQLYVSATANVDPLTNEDYQLWMLPANGEAPISLGLLPQQGQRTLTVPAELDLSQVAALAVSREPLGGSPEAIPTGPVVFTTDLLSAQKT
ncbi:anti-sigma factor [Pseudidiomarina homiensis]|uniref:anti-sigma factor n=1 Tax=Pseudidiomarina homiensis TaxID=364198 RepID=UPI00215AE12D|nr:anti-sigma factor [Pseudidiomarina homiensis]